MSNELTVALKEWAVVQRSLLEGHQIILLRKGGLIEESGDFDLRAGQFLLYPTYAHETERAGDVQPCFGQWLSEEEARKTARRGGADRGRRRSHGRAARGRPREALEPRARSTSGVRSLSTDATTGSRTSPSSCCCCGPTGWPRRPCGPSCASTAAAGRGSNWPSRSRRRGLSPPSRTSVTRAAGN